MKLSVVIVNYNVQYFLEQCLLSVVAASKNLPVEIFVVDNNSVDGSTSMVKHKFPQVILIESKENLGFSKGNNLAVKQAAGEYVLLLNPDTLVEEDTFDKVINFMDEHPDAGGLGVKMVDGKGVFLPESKRSLPTPTVAFYKIFGLSSLFPKSRLFGRYHLGHLSKDQTHQVEILSGAFMLLRKSVLDQIGLLDETFFMYGEDVDLSYRIIKAGYQNYYFADTRIIHYKGESTKKSSVNYVFIFYNAMIIFAKKHFSSKNAMVFSFLIKLAIYFRASIAILNRALKKSMVPLIDFSLLYGGIFLIKHAWELFVKHDTEIYPEAFLFFEIPIFVGVWLICAKLFGFYRKHTRLKTVVQAAAAGALINLIIYSLLSEDYRFSRGILMLSIIWSFISFSIIRIAVHLVKFGNLNIEKPVQKRVAVVGSESEIERVYEIMTRSKMVYKTLLWVSNNPSVFNGKHVGNITQLREIIQVHQIDEVVFCSKDISAQKIIHSMEHSTDNVEFKIAPPESHFIIGSSSINSPGEMYLIDINSLNQPHHRNNKRIFDVLSGTILLLLFPLVPLFYKNPQLYFHQLLLVISGKYSMIGYSPNFETKAHLPALRRGLFHPATGFVHESINEELSQQLNLKYVKDYSILNDLRILLKGITG